LDLHHFKWDPLKQVFEHRSNLDAMTLEGVFTCSLSCLGEMFNELCFGERSEGGIDFVEEEVLSAGGALT